MVRCFMNLYELRKEMENENNTQEYIDLCLTYAQNLYDKCMPVIFDTNHLSLLSGIQLQDLIIYSKNSMKFYNEINIMKKSGGLRKIHAPSENLKYLQRWILKNILYSSRIKDCATGFVQGKSIVDNAKYHVDKECVINLDIKDFFPSIDSKRIYSVFYNLGYCTNLALLLTNICTYDRKLPQGAPTSPYLSNLVCRNLDERLEVLASKIDASYSRYADDITFSGNISITKYISLIKRVINEEKFIVNEKKVRVQMQHHRQIVTGIIVNKTIAVPDETSKYLRQKIYYCKKYGVDNSLKHESISKTNFKGHLFGIAYFIYMVDDKLGKKFIKELNEIKWDS